MARDEKREILTFITLSLLSEFGEINRVFAGVRHLVIDK